MSSLESQIQTLKYKLSQAENYIKYFEKELAGRDNELEIFRAEVSNLKKRLRKALQDIDSKDKDITYLETQLSEIINDVYLLKHRIQKLRQMSTLTSTNTQESVEVLFRNVRADFKYLVDCYRGTELDVLQPEELDNLQNKTEDRLNQIEGRHAYEINQLRVGIVPENEDQIKRQQQFINEQGEVIKKQQDFINECEEKNEALQNNLDL